MGFPCPDSMELSPIGAANIRANGSTAECRCPPGTAQSVITSKCHKLFTKGPCEAGQFFGPRSESPGKSTTYARSVRFNIRENFNNYTVDGYFFQTKEALGNLPSA